VRDNETQSTRVHSVALWVIFSGDGPDPATGVWIGVAGFAGVFLASIFGPKR
jgi:hypothetical protein